MEQTLSNPQAAPAPKYRKWSQYLNAPAHAREVIDAAHAALARYTGPEFGLDVGPKHSPDLGVSFEWHDGATYRMTLSPEGELRRLFRLQYTGAWEWDEELDREVPEESWRTVRAFTRDRAGRVLGPALAGFPAANSWSEAAAR